MAYNLHNIPFKVKIRVCLFEFKIFRGVFIHFSFSCKLLISNGQPPSLAPLSRHARRSALAKAGSDMASFADAQFRLRSSSYAGHAGWCHVCVFLCVSARRQVRRTGRRPMPHCPPRPSEPRRHFRISDFMRLLCTLRVLICGIGGRDGSPGRPSIYGGFGLSAVLAQAGETRPTRPLGSHKM